jgi:hypothetical protein
MTSPEIAAALRAIAAYGLPGSLPAGPAAPLDPVQWDELLLHVRLQRLSPLLARAVSDGTFPATDPQIKEALDVDTQALARVLVLEATLVQAAGLLSDAGVAFRVLKGPTVAHLDYPDPAWRDFGDIDLLVRPDHLELAIAMLGRHGYARRFPEPRAGFDRRFTKSVSVVNPDGLEFDLHRTLAPGPLGLRVQVDMLWDAPPARLRLGGRTLDAMGPDERLLHACYHAVLGNSPPRLVPLRDIGQLLLGDAVDSDRVRRLAAAWRGQAVVAHAISTAWSSLRLTDQVALSTWAAEYVPRGRERNELARAISPRYTFTAQAVDAVRAIRGPRDRLAYLTALAVPDRRYLRGRHPSFTARLRHAVTELAGARTSKKESHD